MAQLNSTIINGNLAVANNATIRSNSAIGGNLIIGGSTILEDISGKSATFSKSLAGNTTLDEVYINNVDGTNKYFLRLVSGTVDKVKIWNGGGIETVGAVNITNTTTSTSTSSGALKVSGGAGINGNIYAGGLISATGDITSSSNAIIANTYVKGPKGFTTDSSLYLLVHAVNEINFYTTTSSIGKNTENGDEIYYAPENGDGAIYFGYRGGGTKASKTYKITDYYFDNGIKAATPAIHAGSFIATSDARLKTNIISYTPEKSILDLPIYKYDIINGDKNQIGCLAQDLQEICPEIVDKNYDGYLGIKESKLIYLLLHEVKKLKTEVEELKNK